VTVTVKVILIAIAALVLFFAGFYVGRLAPKLADAKAEVKQLTQNQHQESTDVTRINAEAKSWADHQLDPVAAPVVRLCIPPPAAVSRAAATRLIAPPAPLRAVNAPDLVPGPDIGRPLVQLGHDADAQIDALWDYIDHVCRVKAR
jgi:hypothetical protein